MKKMLVFDMDGTIADLYGVDNWLEKLRAEDVTPYEDAQPMYDRELILTLNMLRKKGWLIAVTTWVSKGATKDYSKAIAEAKRDWLDKYGFPYDEFHAVKYGRTKANSTRKKAEFQILIDDNKKVRDGWTLGTTVNAEYDILPFLKALI